MTKDTYLRILKDRLDESGVNSSVKAKMLERETAMTAGLASDETSSIFSEERLSVILASALRKSNSDNHTQDHTQNANEESTIVTHSSTTTEETATMVIPSEQDETIVRPSGALPKALLEVDTATIVISRSENAVEQTVILEDKTVVSDQRLDQGINKLLIECGTVHISEKDTAEFFATDEQTVLIPSTAPAPIKSIEPIRLPQDESDSQSFLKMLDEARQQKRNAVDSRNNDPVKLVSEKDLKNPKPMTWLVFAFVILLPLLVAFGGMWLLVFMLGFLCLVLLTTSPLLLYASIVSGSLGGAISSGYFAITLFGENSQNTILAAAILLACLSIFVLSLLFLHRIVIRLYNCFCTILKRFVRFNLITLRSLYRYIVKSAKNS